MNTVAVVCIGIVAVEIVIALVGGALLLFATHDLRDETQNERGRK